MNSLVDKQEIFSTTLSIFFAVVVLIVYKYYFESLNNIISIDYLNLVDWYNLNNQLNVDKIMIR